MDALEQRRLFAVLSAAQFGGNGDDFAGASVVDSEGNIYTLGIFDNSFILGEGSERVRLQSLGKRDFFVAKFTSGGDVVWAQEFGGTGDDAGSMLALSDGQLFVSGFFKNTVDFQPGVNGGSLTSAGGHDAFALSLDPDDGTTNWARRLGSSKNDRAFSVASDSDGNPYFGGEFRGEVDFDPSSAEHNISARASDGFVWALSSDGELRWSKRMGGSGADSTNLLAVAPDSNRVYAAGILEDKGKLGGTTVGSNGFHDFLVGMTSSGGHRSAKVLDKDLFTFAMTASADSVFLTGQLLGEASIDDHSVKARGPEDVWAARLNDDGECLWLRRAGGAGEDDSEYALSIVADDENNAWITCQLDNQPKVGKKTFGGKNYFAPFIIGYSSKGNVKAAYRLANGTGDAVAQHVTFDHKNRLLVTGFLNGVVRVEVNGDSTRFESLDDGFDVLIFRLSPDDLEDLW